MAQQVFEKNFTAHREAGHGTVRRQRPTIDSEVLVDFTVNVQR